MPAAIDISHLGNPHLETDLYAKIKLHFDFIEGDWRVNVRGAANNTIWEVSLTSPKGKSGDKECFAEDGHCNSEYVVKILEKLVKHLR